jgi:hypothetical protein
VQHTVEFTVPTHAVVEAFRVTSDALRGRGFDIEHCADERLTATRGSRVLTILLGALVRPDRHFVRVDVHALHGLAGRTVLRVGSGGDGAAVAGGSIGLSRGRAANAWTADGIEVALSAAGIMLERNDVV